ncbi:unnamed protein product [Schistosoma rodhaini]|uniref:Uncharacterized protein n=2 Tax=Schistosoma rodhaini TaxID=6188 RepID=A0AA85F4K9_9TREM|nr:unnamed protein product [Schistosoma rodhaini]CAH8471794.1 unnamed protein product [Schistosoma rodhaini]
MRNCVPGRSIHLSRFEVNLKENEKEIKKLRQEVNDMQFRSNELLSENNQFSSNENFNIIKNLEQQVDSLKEELKYETVLRSRIEEELSCALSELRFYRTSTVADIAHQEKSEIESRCENFTINFLNEMRAQIYSNLSSFTEQNIPQLNSEKVRYNELIGFGKLRETANEFKRELIEICRRGESAIKSLGELRHKYSILQKQYNGSNQLTEDALHKVAELISLSQTLTNERDDAIQSRENAENELSQLQLVIDKLTEESGQRTREEIDKIEKKANENIENLLSELHHIEKERCQLAIQLEFHKTNNLGHHINDINSECKSALNANTAPGDLKPDCQLDTFKKRAIHAESLCDELKLRLETECNNKEKLVASKRMEIEQLNEKNKFLAERFEYTELQRQKKENHYNKQSEVLFNSELQLNSLKQQLEAVQKSAQVQITSIKQSMKMQEVEYKLKIETLEKVNKLTDENWRNLLNKQQILTSQWRKEAEELANQLEEQTSAFKTEIEKYRRK